MFDRISVKLDSSDEWKKGRLTGLSEEFLEIDTNKVYSFDEISHIKIINRTKKGFGKGFRNAAVFYTGILLINGASTNSSPLIPPEHVAIASGLYAFGWFLDLTSKTKYNLDDWRLEYIDLNKFD